MKLLVAPIASLFLLAAETYAAYQTVSLGYSPVATAGKIGITNVASGFDNGLYAMSVPLSSKYYAYPIDGDGSLNYVTTDPFANGSPWTDAKPGVTPDGDPANVAWGSSTTSAALCQAQCDAVDNCAGVVHENVSPNGCLLVSQLKMSDSISGRADERDTYLRTEFSGVGFTVTSVKPGTRCLNTPSSTPGYNGVVPYSIPECWEQCKTTTPAFMIGRDMECVCYSSCTEDTASALSDFTTVYYYSMATPAPTPEPTTPTPAPVTNPVATPAPNASPSATPAPVSTPVTPTTPTPAPVVSPTTPVASPTTSAGDTTDEAFFERVEIQRLLIATVVCLTALGMYLVKRWSAVAEAKVKASNKTRTRAQIGPVGFI